MEGKSCRESGYFLYITTKKQSEGLHHPNRLMGECSTTSGAVTVCPACGNASHTYAARPAATRFINFCRRREFHAMAKYKWEIARRMLAKGLAMPPAPGYKTGRPVLWFDPDIVIYRNPLHYVVSEIAQHSVPLVLLCLALLWAFTRSDQFHLCCRPVCRNATWSRKWRSAVLIYWIFRAARKAATCR